MNEVRVATLGAVVPHAALQAGQTGRAVGKVHTGSGGVRGEGCDAMSDCRAPGACRQGILYVLWCACAHLTVVGWLGDAGDSLSKWKQEEGGGG
jgi:hypothetical protein